MSTSDSAYSRWRRDAKLAAGAGLSAAICIGITTFFLGYVGQAEARQLIEAMMPNSRLLCSSVLTVTATILALMLTMLSLGSSSDIDLDDIHYYRIKSIALYDAIVFGLTTVLFLMHCVPIHKSEKIPEWWYPTVYYGVLSAAAIVAGSIVGIVAMLYLAVRDLVDLIGLRDRADKSDAHPESERAPTAELE
ncbi:hypothetical protein [Aporhodopirellula aestuarii]|uniref:Transmembrane protein n=1 Tax=Aporhodopirellula aestuarii TaxID=2950107 RepID=A0ABT0UCC3_9BACT|nr:hypothetical protein [Aporhodopirellula aestuarii]MCM2374379.1 hypothetical protein [Aporhodopirellula aestuarii]